MFKKLEQLLEKTRITIEKEQVYRHGRFTIAEIADSKGHIAYGVARKSDEDPFVEDRGDLIALAKAERALYKKLNGRKIHHPFMG